ncbi:MAG: serine hydrolase [Planctomycetota bacterium]|nr:serine hydrolase [Planctomycetota bacterium]
MHRTCLVGGLLLIAVQSRAADESPFIESYSGPIQSFLNDKFADGNAGMVIGLVDERESRVFSAGKLDNGTENQVDGDTIFPLGSVTKVFTSLLLLDAVRRGEMQAGDPVANYLPADVTVPSAGGMQITLQNLAVQDSGLPYHPHSMDDIHDPTTGQLDMMKFKAVAEAITVDDLYAATSQFKLLQVPGESFQYSNTGMALLGNAIERRTKSSYESLVVERLCRPLTMQDTAISLSSEQKTRLVQGHLDDGRQVGHWQFQAMVPAGSLFSTANDMLKFLAANVGLMPSNLSAEMKQMQIIHHEGTPEFGRTAMPWYDSGVYVPPDRELLGHSGHGFGGLAFIAIDTRNRRGVVILTNQLKVSPNPIGWTILQGMPFSPQNLIYAVREVNGIGVSLKPEPKSGRACILIVFPLSPAGKAGITPDLLIERINGLSVEGKSAAECIAMMAGPVGTNVQLHLFDPKYGQTTSIELTKQKFLTVVGQKHN